MKQNGVICIDDVDQRRETRYIYICTVYIFMMIYIYIYIYSQLNNCNPTIKFTY